jgi:hypothetical protein
LLTQECINYKKKQNNFSLTPSSVIKVANIEFYYRWLLDGRINNSGEVDSISTRDESQKKQLRIVIKRQEIIFFKIRRSVVRCENSDYKVYVSSNRYVGLPNCPHKRDDELSRKCYYGKHLNSDYFHLAFILIGVQ